MAGFQKAKAEQAAIKLAMFGPAGSGKTATALLIAEGLGKAAGKRVACVDTERGTDFYVKAVPARQWHPAAFDIDALYTRSLTETLSAVQGLDPATHGVVVLDSMTHLWEAAVAAYRGKKNAAGKIPMHAWDGIKRPYKQLVQFLINSPLHVLILGRQGNEWGTDDESGEVVNTGFKMKAEGETAYEPHILIRMEAIRPREGKRVLTKHVAVPTAFVEKDRSGILGGRLIEWPNYESIAAPILGLLDGRQAQLPDDDDVSRHDADALAAQRRKREHDSAELRDRLVGRLKLAEGVEAVQTIGADITDEVKAALTDEDVDAVRSAYGKALAKAKQANGH